MPERNPEKLFSVLPVILLVTEIILFAWSVNKHMRIEIDLINRIHLKGEDISAMFGDEYRKSRDDLGHIKPDTRLLVVSNNIPWLLNYHLYPRSIYHIAPEYISYVNGKHAISKGYSEWFASKNIDLILYPE